jgi:S-DNA-T family DNA segregation ATPase FtsK/SpoIIIE
MVRSLVERGVRVVALAPRPSPLRHVDGLSGLVTSDRPGEADLAPLLEGDDPLVLAVDDGELLKDAPASDLLKAYVRTAPGRGRGLLVAGDAADLASGYTGWHAEARRARAGALLCPQGLADGELIGVRLPRSAVGEPLTPGRALLHRGNGVLIKVQVPSDPAPATPP